jgi:hypothetical protein
MKQENVEEILKKVTSKMHGKPPMTNAAGKTLNCLILNAFT